MSIMQEFKNRLINETPDVEFLNEKLLIFTTSYKELDVKIVPHKSDWKASIRFKTDQDTTTLNSDLKLIKNGISFAHSGLPNWDDGRFVHNGYKHPFYADVESIFLDAISIDNTIKNDECWIGLLTDWKNEWKPVHFGLMVMFIKDNKINGFIKYKKFETLFELKSTQDALVFNTKSKAILGG